MGWDRGQSLVHLGPKPTPQSSTPPPCPTHKRSNKLCLIQSPVCSPHLTEAQKEQQSPFCSEPGSCFHVCRVTEQHATVLPQQSISAAPLRPCCRPGAVLGRGASRNRDQSPTPCQTHKAKTDIHAQRVTREPH